MRGSEKRENEKALLGLKSEEDLKRFDINERSLRNYRRVSWLLLIRTHEMRASLMHAGMQMPTKTAFTSEHLTEHAGQAIFSIFSTTCCSGAI